ncbi:hypothetical protein RJ639_027079 [Escallonia herrerae]|uniref:Gnk2-homologous domain-containing protein n=1 Tax=Escallonia herrerae TaxID=1293975 RepID=A0AA88X4F3_9ASTE|nr:hypothetical protein RJ639_027079 [Escallonia herrerae]
MLKTSTCEYTERTREWTIQHYLSGFCSSTTPQPSLLYDRCSTGGNYTDTGAYAANLKTLLSSISNSSDLISDGFFNASIGQKEDQVYALALCRGDQTVTSCRSCLNDSSQAITEACPNQKEAVGGYDRCMLRFSNRTILSTLDTGLVTLRYNLNNATNQAQFNDVLGKLLFDLRDRAAAGGVRKYAADEAKYTSLVTIYGLEQCTPDISVQHCKSCLDLARNDVVLYASGKVGAFAIRYSCVLRFETYSFFQPMADAPPPPLRGTPAPPPLQSPPPLSTDTPGGSSNKFRTTIIIAVLTTSALIVVLLCLFLRLRKRKQNVNVESKFDTNYDSKKAWKYWREGAGSNIIDPILRSDSGSIRDIIRCIHIGLLCVQENVTSRPTMASVVLMLNSFSITLVLPSEPAFFMHSSIDPELPILREHSSRATDSNLNFSKNEASISELHPR